MKWRGLVLGLPVGVACALFPVLGQDSGAHSDVASPMHESASEDYDFAFPDTEAFNDLMPSNEPVSLDVSLQVDVDPSILDADDRLRMRLENAIETGNLEELAKFVDMDVGAAFKRRILLTMGEIYGTEGSHSRQIGVYEKFVVEFPDDPEVPRVFLNLGRLYREMGATSMALAKFYNVLNVAINVSNGDINDYQDLSHRAQLEIAETHFSIGEYETAARFFKRLLRMKLTDEDMQNVSFKYSYAVYLTGDYKEAAIGLKAFVHAYPDGVLSPEARYLLADSHLRLNESRQAMIETLNLLKNKTNDKGTARETWLYWKKRTGNQIANLFYHESNFMDALAIYQAMADLSDEPDWRWPVLYQIGLCFEKLLMKPKAVETYRVLVESREDVSEAVLNNRTLSAITEMANWRMRMLESELSMEQDLRKILNNS